MLPALLLSLSLASPMPSALAAVGLTAGEWEKLEKGEQPSRTEVVKVEGKSLGKGICFAIIEASEEKVIETVWKREKHPEFMPRVEKIQMASDDGTVSKFRVTIGVLWKKISYSLELERFEEKHLITWKMDKSVANDIKDTTGTWRFVPLGAERTLVAYDVTADSGVSVPQFLEDYLTRRDLPGILLAVKKRTESNGAWKK
jgi:carbon monoxide dehydrogenase subunit G